MAKQINKSQFVQDVQSGMSKADVASKYEIPAGVAAKFTKELGLKFKRNTEPKYVLIDDEPVMAHS